MPTRRPTEDWVQGIRTYLRDNLSSNWQVIENKGKARLGIRFEDGTRTYKYLPYKWERANQEKIREFIKDVHRLHIQKKLPINEAFAQVQSSQSKPDEPRKQSDPQLILKAWEEFREFKVVTTGKVKPSNWKKEYQSKIEWRLREVADSSNARQLFTNIIKLKNTKGTIQPAGSHARKRTLETIQSFLTWATGSKSNYLLSEDFIPPNDIGDYIGQKSAKLLSKEKTSKPTLTDQEIDLILDACRTEALENQVLTRGGDGDNEAKRLNQQKWKFCIQLTVAYGLRPCEASYKYLEVRGKIKKYVYCTYIKRTGKGASPTGRLFDFEGREKGWNLIERLEKKEPLPDLVKANGKDDEGNENVESIAGNSWKNFLRFNPGWKKLKEEYPNLVPYCFRHSYSRKAHMKYKLSVPEVAYLMRHSVDVHNRNYSQFVTEENMELSVKSAIAEAERRAKYKVPT